MENIISICSGVISTIGGIFVLFLIMATWGKEYNGEKFMKPVYLFMGIFVAIVGIYLGLSNLAELQVFFP